MELRAEHFKGLFMVFAVHCFDIVDKWLEWCGPVLLSTMCIMTRQIFCFTIHSAFGIVALCFSLSHSKNLPATINKGLAGKSHKMCGRAHFLRLNRFTFESFAYLLLHESVCSDEIHEKSLTSDKDSIPSNNEVFRMHTEKEREQESEIK